MPVIDDHQDWYVMKVSKNDTHTTTWFTREIISTDKKQDLDVVKGLTHVIYAFNETIPSDPTKINYHGKANRGVKDIDLLGACLTDY